MAQASDMRWFKRPEVDPRLLRVTPQLECWNKANDPAQVRLQDYLNDTQSLLEPLPVNGPWAIRLDIGLPAQRNLLDMADLDNYLYPLAKRLSDYRHGNSGLVSAWCTKQHGPKSFVRIDYAPVVNGPPTGAVLATTTPPANQYKNKIRAAVIKETALPPGPVRLELAFVVGPTRNWMNLWKPTIDALDPLLGRTRPERDWHPLDGRITELGLHLTVDKSAGYEIRVGIAATPVEPS